MLFPEGLVPRATSQVTISQVETSQMCNFPTGRRRSGRARGPSAAARTGYKVE